MSVTFVRKGYYEVWLGDTQISRHSQEREAMESAINQILSAPFGAWTELEIRGYKVIARGEGIQAVQVEPFDVEVGVSI